MPINAKGRQAENCLNKKDWQTPPEVFNYLDNEFHFSLDVAASDENALCQSYFTESKSAFVNEWRGVVFCNPPYGASEIPKWHTRAYDQVSRGICEIAVLLVPANTDTKAFHFALKKASEIRLVEGRISFVGTGSNSPPGANAIVIYRKNKPGPAKVVSWMNPQKKLSRSKEKKTVLGFIPPSNR